MNKILIFIPSFNDTFHLPLIFEEFNDLNKLFTPTFLVVNDGSTLQFPHFSDRDDVIVINLPFNTGLGTCFKLAMRIFLKHEYDYLLRIDSDGEHLVSDSYELIKKLFLHKENLNILFTRRKIQPNMERNFLLTILKSIGKLYCMAFVNLFSKANGRFSYDVNSGMIAMDSHAASTFMKYDLHRYPEAQMFIIAFFNNLKLDIFEIGSSKRVSGYSTINVLRGINILVDLTFFAINIKGKS